MDAQRFLGIVAGVFMVMSMMIFGFLLGGFLGGRVFGGGMGFDGLADALGGMAVGVIGALVLGTVLALKVSSKVRGIVGVAALIGAMGMVFAFNNYRPQRQDPAVTPAAPAFEPSFVMTVSYSGSPDLDTAGLRNSSWRSMTVRSIGAGLRTTPWDRPGADCSAPLRYAQLRAVANTLDEWDDAPQCDPCPDCVPYAFTWSLPDQRGGGIPVSSACFAEGGALKDLGKILQAIYDSAELSCR